MYCRPGVVQIAGRSTYYIFWSSDAASQEPVVDSAQRVVVARARAPRDAAVQHCFEYLDS